MVFCCSTHGEGEKTHHPPELEASDPEPVLPSTNNSHFSTIDARPVISDGGQGKPCQDEGINLEPSISPTPLGNSHVLVYCSMETLCGITKSQGLPRHYNFIMSQITKVLIHTYLHTCCTHIHHTHTV